VSRITKKDFSSQEEIAELYRRTGALVLRRCRLILKDDTAAEDALQDVFVRVIRYGRGVRKRDIPLSWLYRTAERCCFDRLRADQRSPLADWRLVAELPAVFDERAQMESSEKVLNYLYRMKPKLQQLAMLYYVDGLSQERIASELKWSRRTVGKKLKKLQEIAERLGRLDRGK
jgi:RNA polymerase sigma-70 factor (ECF subfamily)